MTEQPQILESSLLAGKTDAQVINPPARGEKSPQRGLNEAGLLPCSCGREPILEDDGGSPDAWYQITCPNCQRRHHNGFEGEMFWSAESAIENWNAVRADELAEAI